MNSRQHRFPRLARPRIALVRQWSIGIYTGASPFTLSPPAHLANPVLTARDVRDVRARYVADPFMLRKEREWYMFFEVLDENSRRGKIAYARSDDGQRWVYGGIVLEEPFHLSYPYAIAANGEVYLVPESGAAGDVRLYRANPFPSRWVLAETLLTGAPYADSSLVQFRARWWMFTVSDPHHNDSLRLYWADRIEGPWTEHPSSPVVVSNPHWARPAGRVFEYARRLFRYAQDDAPWYGRQVWALEITELTTSRYAEQLVRNTPVLRRRRFGWNSLGMHHVDPHPLGDNRWLACVDGHRHALRLALKSRR
jgi:hypothetical protein